MSELSCNGIIDIPRCAVCDLHESMGYGLYCPCKHVDGKCVDPKPREDPVPAPPAPA